ncbi:MAG: ABC-F family ATP-binding cassette domain-containing protein [Calditrichia bacterium]
MLQIKNLTYAVGPREILSQVNWNIHPGRRYGLIGPNGAGKTTLLRLLIGKLSPESGEIIKSKNYTIGYLPQEEVEMGTGAILHKVMEGRPDLLKIEQELANIHRRLEIEQPASGGLIEKSGELENQYRTLGGYELEAQAKKVLAGLGFRSKAFEQPMSSLSGGWKMRVFLARLLLQNPDLLLLDEPTNHLDLQSLEWLESFLENYPGSLVIVSHDRFFLERLGQEIVEIVNSKLTHYPGDYRFYEQEKELRAEQQLQKQERQEKFRKEQQVFIDRFRYKATKAAQVQSRIKQLEKLDDFETIPSPPAIRFRLHVEKKSFKNVLQAENVWFRYSREWVLQEVDLEIYRGDRLALVGQNGAGKTTLTRLISGQLLPQKGTLEIGQDVRIGYYAQHQVDQLDLQKTILQEVAAAAAETYRTEIRNILGLFQFSGDDVEKRIGILSGGEKARVSLAKILLSPVNFLIMDEPTNHLDIASREALEAALQEYDGTLLLISHDRYFLDKLVNRVLEMNDGRLTGYEGNYGEYVRKREENFRPENDNPEKEITSPKQEIKEQKRREAEARQSVSKQRNQLQSRIKELEQMIEKLEMEKEQAERRMSNPAFYEEGTRVLEMQQRYKDLTANLEKALQEWETHQLELQSLLDSIKKGG